MKQINDIISGITSTSFTTDVTVPSVLGGTDSGSTLNLQGSSGSGLYSGSSINFVANSGGTIFTAGTIYNDGQVVIGSGGTRNTTGLGVLRISQGTSFVDIGQDVVGIPGIWLQQSTPTTSNYTIIGNNSATNINTPAINGTTTMQIGGTPIITLTRPSIAFTSFAQTSGVVTPFTFTNPANTNQAISTEIPGFKVNGGSRQWAGGNITTQRENWFTATTYSFTSASTITNAYGMYIEAPIASTNTTITNNYALGLSGNLEVSGNTLPSVNNTYTLGSASKLYSNIFASTTTFSQIFTGLLRSSAIGQLAFASNSNVKWAQFFDATGNLLIQSGGTYTDNGYRLAVSGNILVTGNTHVIGTITGSSATIPIISGNVNFTGIISSGGTELNSIFSQSKGGSFGYIVDGQSNAISGPNYSVLKIPYNCNITDYYIDSIDSATGTGLTGNTIIEITKNGTSIIGGGNAPTLNGTSSQTSVISGWTTTGLTAGDILIFSLSSSVVKKIYVSINVIKTN